MGVGMITTNNNHNNKILAVSGINQHLTNSNPSKHAVSAQNKVNSSFQSGANTNGMQPLSSSFAERRLSAKIIDNHKKGHSKSGIPAQHHH